MFFILLTPSRKKTKNISSVAVEETTRRRVRRRASSSYCKHNREHTARDHQTRRVERFYIRCRRTRCEAHSVSAGLLLCSCFSSTRYNIIKYCRENIIIPRAVTHNGLPSTAPRQSSTAVVRPCVTRTETTRSRRETGG